MGSAACELMSILTAAASRGRADRDISVFRARARSRRPDKKSVERPGDLFDAKENADRRRARAVL